MSRLKDDLYLIIGIFFLYGIVVPIMILLLPIYSIVDSILKKVK
ncbi:hypothetical protein ES702_03925 [subsurface metagenome]